MEVTTLNMLEQGRDGIVISFKRFRSELFSEHDLRQYYLSLILKAGGPVEDSRGHLRLIDEIQVSQDFITQDILITWKKAINNG